MLGTLGLFLNLAAIISMALWFSMFDGPSSSGATALSGVTTILLFIASFVCFAADHPDDESQAVRDQ